MTFREQLGEVCAETWKEIKARPWLLVPPVTRLYWVLGFKPFDRR